MQSQRINRILSRLLDVSMTGLAGILIRRLMRTVTPPEHQEGVVARAIEQQTAKLPSDLFLWLAGGSIIASLLLKSSGRHQDALFVGQWPAPFLLLGVYNKLVKLHGSD